MLQPTWFGSRGYLAELNLTPTNMQRFTYLYRRIVRRKTAICGGRQESPTQCVWSMQKNLRYKHIENQSFSASMARNTPHEGMVSSTIVKRWIKPSSTSHKLWIHFRASRHHEMCINFVLDTTKNPTRPLTNPSGICMSRLPQRDHDRFKCAKQTKTPSADIKGRTTLQQ